METRVRDPSMSTIDTGDQTVDVKDDDDHLAHPEVELPYILSNKNHQDIARIIGSMTSSGDKDAKAPVVFVVVNDDSSKSNNTPIRRSNQQQYHRSMPTDRSSGGDHRNHQGRAPYRGVEGRTGVYRSDTDYMAPFAKPDNDDFELGSNYRGGYRDSVAGAGRRSAAPTTANSTFRDNDEMTDEDYYYYYKNKYDMSTDKRRSMRKLEDPSYEKHLGEGRQYWRDIILGVNDGMVSTFLLICGVVGLNHLDATDILLTALAGTIAGAISMAAGEFVATKTQNEVFEGEMKLEKKHIAENRDYELEELKEAFVNIGISADDDRSEVIELRERLLSFYGENDDAHLKCHTALELGVVEDERRSEYIAGGVAFFLFLIGAMPSVIPYLCTKDKWAAFYAAGGLTLVALLFVGGVKTWATRGNWLTSALENLAIAVGGGAIAYGVGKGFESLVGEPVPAH